MQQGQEAIDLGVVLILGLLDGCLRQIVAKHVFGIDLFHAWPSHIVPTPLFAQPVLVSTSPLVE